MKNFLIYLEKMGMDKASATMEVDDTVEVWSHEKQFTGIIKAAKWLKSHYPALGIDLKSVDKLDAHNHRYYVKNDSGHYDNLVGLHSDGVGLVCVYIKEFKEEDGIYPKFFYDGEWS